MFHIRQEQLCTERFTDNADESYYSSLLKEVSHDQCFRCIGLIEDCFTCYAVKSMLKNDFVRVDPPVGVGSEPQPDRTVGCYFHVLCNLWLLSRAGAAPHY